MGDPLCRPVSRIRTPCEYGTTPRNPAGAGCPEPGKNAWRKAGGGVIILCDPHDVEAERFVRSGEAIPARRGQ